MHMLSNLEKPDDNARTDRCEEYRETGNNTSNARLRTAWLPDEMASEPESLSWLFLILRRARSFDDVCFEYVFTIDHSKNPLSIHSAVVAKAV